MSLSNHAWIIVKDHLSEGPDDPMNEKGIVGPRGAKLSPDAVTLSQKSASLAASYERHNQFKMYDDDGELYYTGELYWNPDEDGDLPTEEQCYSPLGDFGFGSGCVVVTYAGHPEWECG